MLVLRLWIANIYIIYIMSEWLRNGNWRMNVKCINNYVTLLARDSEECVEIGSVAPLQFLREGFIGVEGEPGQFEGHSHRGTDQGCEKAARNLSDKLILERPERLLPSVVHIPKCVNASSDVRGTDCQSILTSILHRPLKRRQFHSLF